MDNEKEITVDSLESKEKVVGILNALGTRLKDVEDLKEKLGETVGQSIEDYFNDKSTTFDEKLDAALKKIESLENATIGKRFPNTRAVSVPGLEDEAQEFNFLKAFDAISRKDWSDAGFELEVFKASEKEFNKGVGPDNKVVRVLNTTDGSSGSFLVPNEILSSQFIELLRAESVLVQAGARVMENMQGNPVEIPRQSGGATFQWVGEGKAITASDAAFDQVRMSPKQASALTKLTRRFLRQSDPGGESVVREDLARVMALGIDLGGLKGLGNENQPLGIANTSGINTVNWGVTTSTAEDALALDSLTDMVTAVDEDNALRGSLAYIMHPTLFGALRKAKDSDNRHFIVWDPTAFTRGGALAMVGGYPVLRTTQIVGTAGSQEVFFGNFNELLIPMWGGLELRASDQTSDAFEKNQVWIRAIQEVDVALRHAVSFCLMNDADSSKI